MDLLVLHGSLVAGGDCWRGLSLLYCFHYHRYDCGAQLGKVIDWTTRQFVGLSPASAYVRLKMFIILREYLMRYTGEGTRKADW